MYHVQSAYIFKKWVGLYVMHSLSFQTWAFSSRKSEHKSFGKYADIFEDWVSYGGLSCRIFNCTVSYENGLLKVGEREDSCVIKGLLCRRKFTSKQLMTDNSNTALSSRIHSRFHWVMCPASMWLYQQKMWRAEQSIACFLFTAS